MAAIVQAQANKILDASLGTTALTAFSGACKLKLMTGTLPTATVAGTELTGGSGYTTGGNTVIFAAASAGQALGPTVAQSWTNSSGGAWSITGLEIWDSAGTPVRWWFGAFTSQPISVGAGNTFQVAISGITVGLT
jgi:hypothetical protein